MRTAILGARVIDPASGLDQVTDLYNQHTNWGLSPIRRHNCA